VSSGGKYSVFGLMTNCPEERNNQQDRVSAFYQPVTSTTPGTPYLVTVRGVTRLKGRSHIGGCYRM
jgi:hypothetical protein